MPKRASIPQPVEPAPAAQVWLSPSQAPLIAATLRGLGARLDAVGSSVSGRAGDARDALAALGVGHAPASSADNAPALLSDLRAALAGARDTLFLIGDPGAMGADPQQCALDFDTLHDASSRGVHVVSLEPMPASLATLAGASPSPTPALVIGPGAGASTDPGGSPSPGARSLVPWSMVAPLSRFTRPVQDVLGLLEQFGPVRSAVVQCAGAPGDGSMGARLLDAVDLVRLFLGDPESVDAAYTGPSPDPARPVHPLPGDSLRGLQGDLTANLRYAAGRAAAIAVSNHAGRYELQLTLIGHNGRIRVFNDGFEWTDASGTKIDESRGDAGVRRPARKRASKAASTGATTGATTPDAADAPAPSPAALALIDQIQRFRTSGASLVAGVPYARLLAIAQAALLSARTGEGESPATLLRLIGG